MAGALTSLKILDSTLLPGPYATIFVVRYGARSCAGWSRLGEWILFGCCHLLWGSLPPLMPT